MNKSVELGIEERIADLELILLNRHKSGVDYEESILQKIDQAQITIDRLPNETKSTLNEFYTIESSINNSTQTIGLGIMREIIECSDIDGMVQDLEKLEELISVVDLPIISPQKPLPVSPLEDITLLNTEFGNLLHDYSIFIENFNELLNRSLPELP